MKRILLSLVAPLFVPAVLAGCSTIDSPAAAKQDVDLQRVAKIDSAARKIGIEVQWINYPRKTVQ